MSVRERCDALHATRDAQAAYLAAEQARKDAIRAARATGATWQQIANAAALTRQSVAALGARGTWRRGSAHPAARDHAALLEHARTSGSAQVSA